ncbi:TPA: hypothetical protein I7682_18080 [Vibrio vulnificus]|nr:hypothetical protein [Vibrio vulnificus]
MYEILLHAHGKTEQAAIQNAASILVNGGESPEINASLFVFGPNNPSIRIEVQDGCLRILDMPNLWIPMDSLTGNSDQAEIILSFYNRLADLNSQFIPRSDIQVITERGDGSTVIYRLT